MSRGLIAVQSRFGVTETIDRLAETVTRLDLYVFARIDHAAGAQDVGLALRPTQLLIFGNPKGSTPLMQDRQIAGIDLPVKALAWEDEAGKVWLSYNAADWIVARHGLGETSVTAVQAIANGMSKVIGMAAGCE